MTLYGIWLDFFSYFLFLYLGFNGISPPSCDPISGRRAAATWWYGNPSNWILDFFHIDTSHHGLISIYRYFGIEEFWAEAENVWVSVWLDQQGEKEARSTLASILFFFLFFQRGRVSTTAATRRKKNTTRLVSISRLRTRRWRGAELILTQVIRRRRRRPRRKKEKEKKNVLKFTSGLLGPCCRSR